MDNPDMNTPPKGTLSLPLRRLIACLGIIVFLSLYIALISNIGQALPNNPLVQLLFYGLAGTLWGIPVIPIISWSEAYRSRRK
jgi:hypothetical protein